MHCNGKCHLKKQLEKDDKKQDAPTSSKEKSEIQFCSALPITSFVFAAIKILHNTLYIATYPDSPHSAIFHPPSFS